MLTALIADHLTTHWPPRAIKLSAEAISRYAIVQKNRPNLPPSTQSRWLTLERLVAPLPPESLINHLLPQLATINPRPDQLIARYENSPNTNLSFRWVDVLRGDLVDQYTKVASTFLNDHNLSHDPPALSDALHIFLFSRMVGYAVDEAFQTRPPSEIATEMHRIKQNTGSALVSLRCIYNIGLEEAANLLKTAYTQSTITASTPQ
ncbi:MAG: hypothetical protein ACTHN5_21105 [Phycisphaerae bacterium]